MRISDWSSDVCSSDLGLELQACVRAAPLDAGDDLAEAAVLAGAGRFDFDPPALALGVARIHAQQVAGEDRRLATAGAGADLQVQEIGRAACRARGCQYV